MSGQNSSNFTPTEIIRCQILAKLVNWPPHQLKLWLANAYLITRTDQDWQTKAWAFRICPSQKEYLHILCRVPLLDPNFNAQFQLAHFWIDTHLCSVVCHSPCRSSTGKRSIACVVFFLHSCFSKNSSITSLSTSTTVGEVQTRQCWDDWSS